MSKLKNIFFILLMITVGHVYGERLSPQDAIDYLEVLVQSNTSIASSDKVYFIEQGRLNLKKNNYADGEGTVAEKDVENVYNDLLKDYEQSRRKSSACGKTKASPSSTRGRISLKDATDLITLLITTGPLSASSVDIDFIKNELIERMQETLRKENCIDGEGTVAEEDVENVYNDLLKDYEQSRGKSSERGETKASLSSASGRISLKNAADLMTSWIITNPLMVASSVDIDFIKNELVKQVKKTLSILIEQVKKTLRMKKCIDGVGTVAKEDVIEGYTNDFPKDYEQSRGKSSKRGETKASSSAEGTSINARFVPGKINQLRSAQQKDAECGCFAKYNALAIAELLDEGLPLSSVAIERLVLEMVETAKVANWVDEATVFLDLAEVLSDKQVFMLQVTETPNSEGSHVRQAGSSFSENAWPLEYFWRIAYDKDSATQGYFIINLDNSHWVIVVALKEKGNLSPVYYYLDSNNCEIRNHDLARYLIPYFENRTSGR